MVSRSGCGDAVEALENYDGDTMCAWMAGNSRTADDRGGAYEAFCGLQAFATYDDAAFDGEDLLTREPDDISNT